MQPIEDKDSAGGGEENCQNAGTEGLKEKNSSIGGERAGNEERDADPCPREGRSTRWAS